MAVTVYNKNGLKIQVILTESSKTLEQKVQVWAEKGEKRSVSFPLTRAEIEAPHASKLEKLIHNWGVPEGQYLKTKNKILEYIKDCKNIECEEEGPDVNSMISELAEIIKEKINSGEKRITYDDQHIYVEPAYFRELIKDFDEYGYTDQNIYREMKIGRYLKTSKGRRTYQHHVDGKLVRDICICRREYFEEI